MQLDDSDWDTLARLRERFLAAGPGDYWESARQCELYDATFGQRIAWKWRAVWDELARRGRFPAARTVLDWGCGTAVAAREHAAACLRHGVPAPSAVRLFDRSPLPLELAARALLEQVPALKVERGPPEGAPDLLLVSHVLGELEPAAREDLIALARRARTVVWVEPGERTVARELVAARDRLLAGRSVLGPCTHASTCGLNRPGRERDWCHSFAAPAPEAFTRADWREFSRRLKIDLRSVPYAYFALGAPSEARGAGALDTLAVPAGAPGAGALDTLAAPAGSPQDLREQARLDAPRDPAAVARATTTIRILGRPRLEKGQAKLDACDASGVRVLRVLERDAKAFVKELAEPPRLARPFRVVVEGDRVRSVEPAERAAEPRGGD